MLTWEITTEHLNKTWLNKEFLTSKLNNIINKDDDAKIQKIMDLIHNIPVQLWADEDFAIDIIKKTISYDRNSLNWFPKSVWLSSKMNEEFKDIKFFNTLWRAGLKNLYTTMYEYDEANLQIKEVVKNHLSDKSWIVEYLEKNKENFRWNDIYILFPHLSEECKELVTPTMENALKLISLDEGSREHGYHTDFVKTLPKKLIADKNNLIYLFNHYAKTGNEYYLGYQLCFDLVEYINQDPDLIKQLEKNNSIIDKIWTAKNLAPKYKRNLYFMDLMLSKSPHIYNSFTSKWKETFEVINSCITHGGAQYVPMEIILKYKEKIDIAKIIQSEESLALMVLNNAPEYRTYENILKTGKNIRSLNLVSEDYLNLLGKDVQKYLSLLELNQEVYYHFPQEIKEDKKILLYFLENIEHISEYELNKVPQQAFEDIEIALVALNKHKDNNWNKFISEKMWENKDFAIGFAQILDTSTETEKLKLLEGSPQKVRKFFEAFEVTENYNQFVLNYILEIELNQIQAKSKKQMKI